MEISKVEEFIDDKHRSVHKCTVVEAENEERVGQKRFFGRGVIIVEHPRMPGQGIPRPFDFPFPTNVEEVKEAFEKFDAILQSEAAKLPQRPPQPPPQQIVLPGAVPPEMMKKIKEKAGKQ